MKTAILLGLMVAGAAWSQTPSGALYNYLENDQNVSSEYIDMTLDNAAQTFAKFRGYGPLARAIDFRWVSQGAPGACWDLRFTSQSGIPAPNWSIWVKTNASPENWILASDDVDNRFPRLRLWVANGSMIEFILKGAGDLESLPLADQGAAWMHTREATGLSQSQCENVSYNTVRVINNVVTKLR